MTNKQSIVDLSRRVIREVVTPSNRAIISADAPLPQPAQPTNGTEPDFDLFHFVLSVCSQKARATLAELGVRYSSNELVIFPPANQNYAPQYVSLRLLADAAKNRGATGYTGRTSVNSEGFDALVVPTLVDRNMGKVVADSKSICVYLCERFPQSGLIADDLRAEILRQLDIVDAIPNAALLYGAHPDQDMRPAHLRETMPGIHALKIAMAERNRDLPETPPEIRSAYDRKILKERAAADFVVDSDRMRSAIAEMDAVLGVLEEMLRSPSGPWLFGHRFTLADIFWAVSLFRLQWLGYARYWNELAMRPHVGAYAERLYAKPSVESAIIRWPGHPPGEFVDHLLP